MRIRRSTPLTLKRLLWVPKTSMKNRVKHACETRQKNENFGSSLLLANSPMSPKIVNGSFAAIYDTADVFNECMKTLGRNPSDAMDSPAMRRRIRGILMSGKQFSLDSRMDLVQGAVCCRQITNSGTEELPLMKEDDDPTEKSNSRYSRNKIDSSIDDVIE